MNKANAVDVVTVLEQAGFRAIVVVVRAVVKALVMHPSSCDVVASGMAAMSAALVDLARTGAVVPPTPHNVRSFYDALRSEVDRMQEAQAEAESRVGCDYLDVLRAAIELARIGQLETVSYVGELRRVQEKLRAALAQVSLTVEVAHPPKAGPSWNGRHGLYAHDQDGCGAVLVLSGAVGQIGGPHQEIPDAPYQHVAWVTEQKADLERRVLAEAAKRCMSIGLSDAQKARAFVVLENYRHVLAMRKAITPDESSLRFKLARRDVFERIVDKLS